MTEHDIADAEWSPASGAVEAVHMVVFDNGPRPWWKDALCRLSKGRWYSRIVY